MKERWRAVVDYEGLYEVSDQGRVKSLPRATTRGGILKPIPYGTLGHLRVNLSKDGKARLHFVHTLVLTAFVGPRPEGKEGCHYPDRDPTNNRLGNLMWGTRLENMMHKTIHGTHPDRRGENHPLAKLSDSKIAFIFECSRAGNSQKYIALTLGVDPSEISRVLSGKRWNHLLPSSNNNSVE
jgi:hypothetical protein